MIIRHIRATCLAGAAALSIVVASMLVHALVVFDHSNYAVR